MIEHTAEVQQVDDTYPVGGPADRVWPPGRVDQSGITRAKTDPSRRSPLHVPFLD